MQLAGGGVLGDGTLEGNEEALTVFSDNILIDQLRHAVRTGGRMSQQRVPFDIREEARVGLTDWWADRIDTAFFNHICGFTAQSDLRYSGNNAILGPSTGRVFFQGAGLTTDELVASATSSNAFVLSAIDNLVTQAKLASPLIRPVSTELGDYYVLFMHPLQVRDMRANTAAAGSWTDIQKAAMTGGVVERNPIFTGALGIYNGVILHESPRVTRGVNSTTSVTVTLAIRSVLCGAQAAAIAFGQDNSDEQMTWTEEFFDYGNQLGVSGGCIYGIKKTQFNSTDFGTLVYVTSAVGLAP
jgi:N4-gp56 family major capsid protein